MTLGRPTPLQMSTDPTTGAPDATAVALSSTSGALSSADLSALQAANVVTFRYDLPASTTYMPGTITIAFPQDSTWTWQDSAGDTAAPQTFTITALGPQASLVTPTNGSAIDIEQLNGRAYVDVTLPAPPTGYAIDWNLLNTSMTPIFTLSGAGSAGLAVDTTQLPDVTSEPNRTVRYWLTGSPVAGDVTLTFVPGGPPLTATLGTVTSGGDASSFRDRRHRHNPGRLHPRRQVPGLLVGRPARPAVGPQLPAGRSRRRRLGTVQLDHTVQPQLQPDGITVQYQLTGKFKATGGAVTVSFVPGTFNYTNPGSAGLPTYDAGDLSKQDRYIDLALTPTSGTSTTISGAPAPSALTLSEPGATLGIDTTTPLLVGMQGGVAIYRYYVTGKFTTGLVSLSVAKNAFADSAGYQNVATSLSFTATGPTASLQSPPAGATVGPASLDNQGYIDVPFVVPTGDTIVPSTVTNGSITLGGGFTGTLALNTLSTAQAPLQVGVTGTTYTFRFWTTGNYGSGSVTVTYVSGGWSYTDGTVNSFAGPVAPVNLTVGATTTPNVSWIDLLISPAAGDQLISGASPRAPLHARRPGRRGVAPRRSRRPDRRHLDCRFFVHRHFGAGRGPLDFAADSFASNPTGDAACRRSTTPPTARASR